MKPNQLKDINPNIVTFHSLLILNQQICICYSYINFLYIEKNIFNKSATF